MFRKMLSVLLCIVLGLGCSSSALASDIVDDDLFSARANEVLDLLYTNPGAVSFD